MTVEFTQFVRPNGERRQIYIELEDFVEHAAHEITAEGGVFTVELLSTGHVALCCEFGLPSCDGEVGDIAIEVCPNGPQIPEKAKEMILKAREILRKEGVFGD